MSITVQLPETANKVLAEIARLEGKDCSTLVKEILEANFTEWRREKAIELYKQGGISLRKAAKLADTHILRFQNLLWERRVPLNWTPEDVDQEFEALKKAS